MNELDKDRVVSDTIWRCNYCNEPVVFESKELAMAHTDYCIYNEENSSCFLCEHLKVIQHTEYEPHVTNKLNNVRWAIGTHRTPYCMKFDKVIEEKDFISKHEECFVYSDESMVIESTPEFIEQDRLVEEADKYIQEVSKKA